MQGLKQDRRSQKNMTYLQLPEGLGLRLPHLHGVADAGLVYHDLS